MALRLEIKGLSKFFPGVRALDDVSMSVEAGEIRALLGENGRRQIHPRQDCRRCLFAQPGRHAGRRRRDRRA